MIFPSIDSALAFVKSRLQEFYDQSRVLKDRMMTLGQLLRTAKERNDQAAIGQILLLQTQTKQLFLDQLALEQKLMPFANHFGVNVTLGALPVIIAASAVAVAGLLYLHFQKLQNQKKAMDLVAKGLLTPAEAKSFMEAGSVLGTGGLSAITGNIGTMLIAGAALFGMYLFSSMKRA